MNSIKVLLPDDLLGELRRLHDEWLELLDMPSDVPPLRDDQLVAQVIVDWMDDTTGRLVKLTEARSAAAHGGRTPYMFDDNGNEYYATVDGARHYTRLEG